MYNSRDNIVALATIPGKSALNVIRCSGNLCVPLYKKLLKEKKVAKPNYVHLKNIYSNKQVLDQCMVTFFEGPKSYTGENMIEFSTHGGGVIANQIIRLIESNNFRPAEPGEFTYRAFINGKLDLSQAESIKTTIDSGNNIDALFSIKNVRGHFSEHVLVAKDKIKRILSFMEHELDFNENEIDFKAQEGYIEQIKESIDYISSTLNGSYLSKENKSSVLISLAGKTNAGKSSLFNKILGYERSIVTRKKGTTRDTVEAEIIIKNINVRLIDTAGIRKTKELIEKKGISRTLKIIKNSDLILFVDDISPKKKIATFKKIFKNKKVIFINSKSDLKKHISEKGSLSVSSKTNEGINMLLKKINNEIDQYLKLFMNNNLFLINSRQKNILKESIRMLEKSLLAYTNTKDSAIASSYLRSSFNKLSEIQGYADKDEIINNIFKGFCVGK